MSNNTKFGTGSLANNSSGSNNTAIGFNSANGNTTGNNNTALGINSALRNTTGTNNTSLGTSAMIHNTTGISNTAVGARALAGTSGSSVGNRNTAVGVQSLDVNEGEFNTAIGLSAGLGVVGGNYNTFLGANTTTSGGIDYENSTAIGYNAQIQASNQIMLGGNTTSGFPDVIIPGNAYLPNYTTATDDSQIVPKSYVDLVATGLTPTQACICATTENIDLTLTTAPTSASTDGFNVSTLTDGDYYILVVNQGGSANTLTSDVENGVYILTIDTGAGTYTWSRPPSGQPMSDTSNAKGAFSLVKLGDTYARTGMVQINDPAIVGTDPLQYQTFYQLNFQIGQGLNAVEVGIETTINVDSSLNFINFLDSTTGVTGASGTLALGTYSDDIVIGPTGGNPIQVQSQIQAQQGITGGTGSFTNLRSSNDTYLATSSSKVGIAKTSAIYTLDVSGNLRTASSRGEFTIETDTSKFNYNGFNPNAGTKVFWAYPVGGNGRTTFLNNGQGQSVNNGFDFYMCGVSQNTPILATIGCGKIGIGKDTPSGSSVLDVNGSSIFSVPPTCTVSASSSNQFVNYNNFASTSGTWTVTLSATGGGTVTTYTVRSGKYIVVNKLCTVQLELFVTNRGSLSGGLQISLPFTCDSSIGGSFTIGSISGLGSSINAVDFSALCNQNSNLISLYKRTSATSTGYVALDAVSDTSANAFRIHINGTYLIA